MDGNFPQGGVVRGGPSSYGGFDLQTSMNQHRHSLHEGLPFTMATAQTCDHHHNWTDKMVKLLITAVSYIGDDSKSERSALMQKQWIESRTLQLEEQKLQIQVELLELEKQRFRWERFSKKRDQELERMRMENERMKLENDRMGLELKQRELGVEL
ncbi:BnaA06g14990D [Brassica napus]|uniref:BnaA06g14990D protein n=1 Tax=Brassica napus TaxID=3708 RepID=A0A078GVB2_BRANA|nr:BnaA06g14990D [Brassica napus]